MLLIWLDKWMIEHLILCPSTWDEVDHQLGSARNNVYRSCKLRTHSGLRISNDHTLDSCQFSWYLFCNSKLDALSAACPSAFTAVLCCFPSMGRQHNIGHTECAGKPRRPTYWEQQSLLSTLIVQRLYVCVLRHLSSQCTVFWTITRREIVAVTGLQCLVNALFAGRGIPLAVFGPRVSLSAALMMRFIPMTKRMGNVVHPMTIPFSTFWYLVHWWVICYM